MTSEEIQKIEPLMNGQIMKELTIKMLVDEMAQWWSSGWGWIYPWQSTFDSVKYEDDEIFTKSLLEIKKSIEDEGGFVGFLIRYTGLDETTKRKYIDRYFNDSSK